MKVTLDTNVLISGTFWEGEAFRIIKLVEQEKVQCFLSKDILEEYDKVMHSEEIVEKTIEKQLNVKSAIIKIVEICEIVEPRRRINAIREDLDDNKILECAVEAKVDYIVTYDKKHLLKLVKFEGIDIVSPSEFLKLFEK